VNVSKDRRSTLLLMELVLSILIFAACAGICLRIFAYAEKIAQGSRALNGAVLAATTAAERYKTAGGYGQPMAQRYDEEWNENENGPYHLTLTEKPEGGAEIVVEDDTGVIYTLTVRAVSCSE
jgi:type II secretory pathway pseudopilin PulG